MKHLLTNHYINYTCSLMQIPNLHKYKHVEMVKTTCWSWNWESEWRGCWCWYECFRNYFYWYFPTQLFLGFTENGLKDRRKWKCFADLEIRMATIFQVDKKATATQLTTCYNKGMQKSFLQHTPVGLRTGNWDYKSRLTNFKLDNRKFQLQHLNGMVRIWHNEDESMDPSCLGSILHAAAGGVM